MDHRDDSTFSFDPSNLDVKQLDKNKRKKIDSRKGVLLSSYTRKRTRRRKGKAKENHGGSDAGIGKATPSPGSSPRHGSGSAPQQPPPPSPPPPPPRPRILTIAAPASPLSPQPADTVGPLFPGNALGNCSGTSRSPSGRILPTLTHLLLGLPKRAAFHSRQASSNSGEGNFRESSLDDSGVVDDHEDGDPEDVAHAVQVCAAPKRTPYQPRVPSRPILLQARKVESVTIAVKTKEKEIRVLKCNGVSPRQDPKKLLKEHLYSLPPDYLSHIVVLDDLVDRNCESCMSCCVDYDGWLRYVSLGPGFSRILGPLTSRPSNNDR